MRNDDIAVQVLGELYPKSKWTQGARDTGIHPKTFERIMKRQSPIKSENWDKLMAWAPFVAAFSRARGASDVQLDRKTRETMGLLASSLGPRVLSLIALEIRSIASRVGPDKALNLVENLRAQIDEIAEAAANSSERQKID